MKIEAAIRERYSELSETLQAAADYVLRHQLEVATRSLRAIAASSDVSPASFSRLARALGYQDYEEMREQARLEVSRRADVFSAKARRLLDEEAAPGAAPLLHRQIAACADNLESLSREIDVEALGQAADRLHAARKVVIVGTLGSAGFADYFGYLMTFFAEGWSVAGRSGDALASALSRIGPEDAVVVVSKTPYARRSVRAAQLAAARGACVVALTDSRAFPAAADSDYCFIAPSESPQFFSSYVATVALIETLAGMLLARAGPDAEAAIEKTIAENRLLEEFVADLSAANRR